MSRAPLQWWVRAGSRAYGPYASERLPAFLREGRLTPETSVANDPSGPWWPAGRNPSLEELFAAPRSDPARPETQRAAQPVAGEGPQRPAAEDQAPRPAAEPQPSESAARPAGGAHALLVFAELLEGRDVRFATVLERLGPVARARPGVWLLRASGDAAAVRNALSQAL
ncbi:MAG: hypothetical protein INR64_14380, partial [Caulobacteraceae bacterium]|nr:hypothetical protein [Caulobacter sp.]